jgi:hypothetical protein
MAFYIFNSRHAKFSDLHKQNLAKALGTLGSQSGSPNQQNSLAYRDRAKERRKRFGIGNEPASNSLKVCMCIFAASHAQ